MHGASEAVSLDEVCQRLVDKYGKKKGFHLYSFYKVYYGESNGRTKLKKYLARWSIWYNLQQLSKAGIGLQVDFVPEDFNLTIPSDYSVNELHPAGAGESGGC